MSIASIALPTGAALAAGAASFELLESPTRDSKDFWYAAPLASLALGAIVITKADKISPENKTALTYLGASLMGVGAGWWVRHSFPAGISW